MSPVAEDNARMPTMRDRLDLTRPIGARRGARGHAPDAVADVVGDEQRAALIDGDADRTAARVAVAVEESGEDVDRLARRTSDREGHEDDLVAAGGTAVPGAVLADEHAACESRAELGAAGEDEAQRRDMGAERI